MKENKILDEDLIENFCELFVKYLNKYKLSYYLRDTENNFSKENIIHSAIIWIRFCTREINKSKIFKGCTEAIELYTLISIIDTLSEGLDQLYRVLYKENINCYGDEKEICFKDLPENYSNLKNRKCFKEIRAMFSIHPVNLQMPNDLLDRRYADLFYAKSEFSELADIKGDFYTRIWTRTRNDEDTIYFPLYIEDIIKFCRLIYSQLEDFIKRVNDIANKKI